MNVSLTFIKAYTHAVPLVHSAHTSFHYFPSSLLTPPIEKLSYPRRNLGVCQPLLCFHLVWLSGSTKVVRAFAPNSAPPRKDMIQGLQYCVRSLVAYPSHGPPLTFSNNFRNKRQFHLLPKGFLHPLPPLYRTLPKFLRPFS